MKARGTTRAGYEMKLISNIGRAEPWKLGLPLLAGCLLLSMALLAVSRPYAITLPALKSLSMHMAAPTSIKAEKTNSSLPLETKNGTQERNPLCNPGLDLCEMDGDFRSPNISSVSVVASAPQLQDRSDSDQPETKNGTQERTPLCNPGSDLCRMNGDYIIPNISSTAIAASSSQQQDRSDSEQPALSKQIAKLETKPVCDFSDPRSDVCEMDGDIRIHGSSSSIIFLTSSQTSTSQKTESWRIKPHPRKGYPVALARVTEVSVISSTEPKEAPRCSVNHSIPAIVFSIGGYMGNIFHDFTDALIPLFITSRQYEGEVQFFVSEYLEWWILKYEPILKQLSRYEIIDFNRDQRVHCYPHVVVGLQSHKEMTIDPSRSLNGYSMVQFGQLMSAAFALERRSVIRVGANRDERPRLLIIARKWSRAFTNVDEIVRMAEGLGYEVVVAEAELDSDLVKFAHIVNSCDVMLGVHGAGLTNLVFLPPSAIVIQVVPLGGLEGIAWGDFGVPSLDMKLKYLDYKIVVEESTLTDLYPRDHPVLKDPMSVHRQGWLVASEIYLGKQNVRIDVGRLSGVLLQALELLKL